jgi:hypothetical protein
VAVIDTLGLENSVARNRTLAYLAQVSLGLLDKGELEARLEALEAALGPRALKTARVMALTTYLRRLERL